MVSRVDYLRGIRVVTMALNLPGPVASARLRDLGADVAKVEPPSGDPFEQYCPRWYAALHEGIAMHRIDLKADAGRAALDGLLREADLFVTAQRPSALERLGLAPAALARRFPRLCHVAITGHAPPEQEVAGHDLTYMAVTGLVAPPALPATLFADMAGAERAVTTALALLLQRERRGPASHAEVPLEEAAQVLAQPRREGLTGPGALLGGRLAGYNFYRARDGWLAVAALETHFARALAAALETPELTHDALASAFIRESAAHWEAWARERDLPIVAVRGGP